MRVLLVNTLYPPQARGGAEKSVALLAHALAEKNCTVTVLASSDRAEDYIHQDGPVRVVRVRQRNLYQWPSDRRNPLAKVAWHLLDIHNRRMATAAVRQIRHERFDVINTNNLTGFSAALVPLLAKTFAAPVVHTVRDYSLLCTRGTLFRSGRNCTPRRCLSCRVVTGAKRFQNRYFAGAIGISQAVLDHHRPGYFAAGLPTAVIPNIFGTPQPGCTFRLRKPDAALRHVGFLGRITPEKGVPNLCEAFLGNPRCCGGSVLKIAGRHDSPYAAAVVRKYARANIQFLGPVEPGAFLAGLDALVVPSLWDEPLGRVALEAIAQGCPVLSADRGGLTETIRHTRGGWLYQGDRPDLDLICPIDTEVDLSYCAAPVVAGQHLEFFARLAGHRP